MYDITVGGPGLVAVGGDADQGAVVWTSDDGLVWVRVPHDESIFGGGITFPFIGLAMVSVAAMDSVAAGEQDLVAVGGGVWTSIDGVMWTRVTDRARLFESGPSRVIAEGPGYFLFSDGGVWTAVPDEQ
jgi:hypothetical protein